MKTESVSIFETAKNVREGKLSAKEVTTKAIQQAKALNPKLNAFITICEAEAMKAAEAVDAKVKNKKDPGLLAGVPIAVKDLLLTKGIKTTAASKILNDFIPQYSSTVTDKLEQEGAIIIGKANLDEFAMGASNENSAFGAVKNPWDLTRVPGGSSGGSAAAVAAGICRGSIGTDTGGSIREPAHFCGIAGIKPTYGRVSRYGVVAFASSLDQVGPMALTVEDAAIMLKAISGKDPRDSTSANVPVPDYQASLVSNVKGLKIGLPKEYFAEGLEPESRKVIENAISILKAQGAEFVDISLPLTPHGIAVYYIVAPCEASANLARYDGVRFGHRSKDANNLKEMYKFSRGEGFGAEPKRRIMLGTFALSSGYYDAYYRKACQVRRLIYNEFIDAFKKCDIMLTPVTTGVAFKLNEKKSDPLAMYLNDLYTLSPSLAGIPGVSVNAGFSKEGLPIGVQLLGRHFDESQIIQAAYTIESFAGVKGRLPNEI